MLCFVSLKKILMVAAIIGSPLILSACGQGNSSPASQDSEVALSKPKNGEVSADIANDPRWAGPWSQQYFPDSKKPQGDFFNAKAQCQLPERKHVAVVQQSPKNPSDAIRRALALCNVRCSDTGYGGCTIVKQFVAKLLPRVDGQPSKGYVCKMTENKPLAEPVRNRSWPSPPGETITEAREKGEEFAQEKAGIEIQPVKCVNNDYEKSEILVRADNQESNG